MPANFILANRFDAVGSTSEANTLYKEGTGYPALTPFSIDYAFVRDACGQQGSITNLTPCPLTAGVADTDNNAVDFYFVDTNGTSVGAGQRLGSPGPENLASPIQRNASLRSGSSRHLRCRFFAAESDSRSDQRARRRTVPSAPSSCAERLLTTPERKRNSLAVPRYTADDLPGAVRHCRSAHPNHGGHD